MEDTTFAAFTPSTKVDAAVPILLFQSGYGSTSKSHAPLMQAIADAGFVCVIPDREGDTKGGKESAGKLLAGLATGTPASEHNAMSTDGTHLVAALAWCRGREEVEGQAIDVTKVAVGGFSMGCVEAIMATAACAADVKATVIISPSTGTMLEKAYVFSQEDLLAKVSAFSCPSLYITSDKDFALSNAKDLYAVAKAPASIVVFKDEVLDNSMALSEETSTWSAAIDELLPGLRQHFALAAERGLVSDAPILAFLNQHLKGAANAPLASAASVAEVETK